MIDPVQRFVPTSPIVTNRQQVTPAANVQNQANVQPSDSVNIQPFTQQQQAPAQQVSQPMQAAPAAPPLSPQMQQLTQQVASNLILQRGKETVQQMMGFVQRQPETMPLFDAMGKASDGLAQKNEVDLYFHLNQNALQLNTAQSQVAARLKAGSDQSYGQLLSEEMKVQGEVQALVPHVSPQLLQELGPQLQSMQGDANTSSEAKGLALLKQKLPPEVVAKVQSELPQQPLYAASEAAKSLKKENSSTITAISDLASGFYPLALGARSAFFQAAQGVGNHPAQEFTMVGQRLGQLEFSPQGDLARISPKFAEFAARQVGDPSNSQYAFGTANNLSVMLLAMYNGSQRAQQTGTDRETEIQNSLKTLVLQQNLMAQAGPYLQQSAMQALQNGQPPAPSNNPMAAQLGGNDPSPEAQFNRHLLNMMSPDQVANVAAGVQNNPLTHMAQQGGLSQLQDSFQLPPGGEIRLRTSLGQFTGNLMGVQQAVMNSMNQGQMGQMGQMGNRGY